MCHTTSTQDMPLETPGAAQMGDLGQLNIPGLSGPATNAVPGQSADASPTTVSVKKPTKFGRFAELATMGGYDPTGGEDTTAPPGGKVTKYGALLNLVRPMIMGGMVGLAGGKSHPGGGWGASDEFWNRQRAFNMQREMLSRQLYNDQFKNLLDYARTQHTLNQPNFNGRGAAPIKGRDESGKLVYMRPNPQTGVYEPIEGITPDEEAGKFEMTDQGGVVVDPRNATARPVTMNGASGTGVPTGPPTGIPQGDAEFHNASMFGGPATDPAAGTLFDSGKARIPLKPGVASQSPSGIKMAASQGGVPLGPPNRHNDTLQEKAADALRAKHPDWGDDEIYAAVEATGRKPEGGETAAQRLARVRARNQAEREKGQGLRRAEDDIRKRYGLTGYAANEPWPQEATDELEDAKQRVQDEYESKLGNLGADVSHFDYHAQRNAGGAGRPGAGARGKTLDRENPEDRRIAAEILQEAGGDTNKARRIAKQRGFAF